MESNTFFENENDRRMYELLYVLRNGTNEDLDEYLNSHPIPEQDRQDRSDHNSSKSREEITEELVDLLMEMQDYLNKKYFISDEEEEPATDSTDTEEQEDTTHATEEDNEAIFDILLGGYDKALEEIGARVYEDVFNKFTSLTGYAKVAPISVMFLGYSAGFTHGMEAMSKITEAASTDEAK